MSLAPGIPRRPSVGVVVLQHEFVVNQATIVGLAPDVVPQGANVFKGAATTEAQTVIAQVAQKGVVAAPTGDSGFHAYNVGYPGDRDVSIKVTLPAHTEKADIFYICDGLDTTDDGLGFILRVEDRNTGVIRFRIRSAIIGDGTVSGRNFDAGSSTIEVTTDPTVEHTYLIEHRSDAASFYLDGSLVGSYTYTAVDLAVINGGTASELAAAFTGSNDGNLVNVGILGKNADVLLDDFIVTLR